MILHQKTVLVLLLAIGVSLQFTSAKPKRTNNNGIDIFNFILNVSDNYLFFKKGGNDTTLFYVDLKTKQTTSTQIPQKVCKSINVRSKQNFDSYTIASKGYCKGDTITFTANYYTSNTVNINYQFIGDVLVTDEDDEDTTASCIVLINFFPKSNFWSYKIIRVAVTPFGPEILLTHKSKTEDDGTEQHLTTLNNHRLMPLKAAPFSFDMLTTFAAQKINTTYWSVSVNYNFPLVYFNESPFIKIFNPSGIHTTFNIKTKIADATRIISAQAQNEILKVIVETKDKSNWVYDIDLKTREIIQHKKLPTKIQMRDIAGIADGTSDNKHILSNAEISNGILYYFNNQNKLSFYPINN